MVAVADRGGCRGQLCAAPGGGRCQLVRGPVAGGGRSGRWVTHRGGAAGGDGRRVLRAGSCGGSAAGARSGVFRLLRSTRFAGEQGGRGKPAGWAGERGVGLSGVAVSGSDLRGMLHRPQRSRECPGHRRAGRAAGRPVVGGGRQPLLRPHLRVAGRAGLSGRPVCVAGHQPVGDLELDNAGSVRPGGGDRALRDRHGQLPGGATPRRGAGRAAGRHRHRSSGGRHSASPAAGPRAGLHRRAGPAAPTWGRARGGDRDDRRPPDRVPAADRRAVQRQPVDRGGQRPARRHRLAGRGRCRPDRAAARCAADARLRPVPAPRPAAAAARRRAARPADRAAEPDAAR